jgi:hydrogenase expression/formation protein HypE
VLDLGATCPVPVSDYERVVLGHGSGGRLSHELLTRVILPALGRDPSAVLEDQATLPAIDGRIAVLSRRRHRQPRRARHDQ